MANINTEKLKAIEAAMGQIEKQFGKGSIMKLGEHSTLNIDSISSGCLDLDIALGIGGVPRGRIIEIYGPEASGKTTVALHIAAEAQKVGGAVGFIDAEHALDPTYAKALGVDIDSLIVSQPDTGEQALEIAEALVRSGAIDVIVVDSVAALVPRAEIEGEMGDAHVGLQARLMSQALRKLAGTINKSKCVTIFINQLREKVGVMFGNPETTPGGRALKFYASVRMDVRRIDSIKQSDSIVGNRTRVKIMKNKVAPPFKQAEFDIMYNEGISREGNIVDVGVRDGIVQKSGAWFSYGDIRLGQGRENAKQYLKDNPEVALEIENKIRAKYELPLNETSIKKEKEKENEEKETSNKKDSKVERNKSNNSEKKEESKKQNDSVQASASAKGEFVSPIKDGKITRSYNLQPRIENEGKTASVYKGVDIEAAVGTEVKAIANGKILEARQGDSKEGFFVKVEHSNGIVSMYANLDKDLKVKAGDNITQGSVLGKVGSTVKTSPQDRVSSEYLLFHVEKSNEPMDPQKLLSNLVVKNN